ncbi:alpha-ketoglutarate-dependent dioxygenase AlkB [Endozoicomonas sp. OPT23]|uniref:alpha-ketoglutarate-dependent dioxygenase AlkB family protein n=1 Tax=Endozoicomonas sp. OPT23 TaxID=2072845 RepID=UPI00129BDEA0|nr:alpha-ketoglutarate-dependent dioxygenase AlkB [Endozoicomonas sp. OPT23]MRI32110.1 alpha-ketoglutarate-dependent dioxygenase AlkB [Endozoicomonas sp. OPT23]
MDVQTITAPDTELTLWPQVYSDSECCQLFAELHQSLHWQQDQIKIFGKVFDVPRLQAWYADPGLSYQYSGIQLQPETWTPLLLDIRKQVETQSQQSFNSVLVNLYRDGQDSNGWHADNEPELGVNPVIASLSLGETRRFRLKHRQAKDASISPITLDLKQGSLLLMAGRTQSCWQHCITKTARTVQPRINLTFRNIIDVTSPL